MLRRALEEARAEPLLVPAAERLRVPALVLRALVLRALVLRALVLRALVLRAFVVRAFVVREPEDPLALREVPLELRALPLVLRLLAAELRVPPPVVREPLLPAVGVLLDSAASPLEPLVLGWGMATP